MRLSAKKKNAENGLGFHSGLIRTSADRRVTATEGNGTGPCAIVSPGGMSYIPQPHEEAVVLTFGGQQLCVGVRVTKNEFGVQPGELVLYSSGGASVHLKNNGQIHLRGEVYLNGSKLEVN